MMNLNLLNSDLIPPSPNHPTQIPENTVKHGKLQIICSDFIKVFKYAYSLFHGLLPNRALENEEIPEPNYPDFESFRLLV